jgi:nucleotide-binding universal stress UspA family protein
MTDKDAGADHTPPQPPRPALCVPRPAPGTRPVRLQRSTDRRIVLALRAAERPNANLERALSIARALDARLHVLCVLPAITRLRALFSSDCVTAARTVERTLEAHRATRDCLQASAAGGEVVEHVAIVHGRFVEQAAAYAATIDSKLIIVPPRGRRYTRLVTSLAGAAQVPVLVAHERRGKPAIVAATDLQTQGYPVLREAAEFGRKFNARVIALHNVEPVLPSVASTAWTINLPPLRAVRAARSVQLTQAAERLTVEAQTVVLDEFSSAGAILAETTARDADYVAVGIRRRKTWLDEFASGRVASEVISRAPCSVLVLPLGEQRPRSSSCAF